MTYFCIKSWRGTVLDKGNRFLYTAGTSEYQLPKFTGSVTDGGALEPNQP
jgi:hypothetical protein